MNMKNIFIPMIMLSTLSAVTCTKDPIQSVTQVVRQLTFHTVETSEPDSVRTLTSLKKEGDLFLMTYYGDYSERLEALNDRIVAHGISSVIPSETDPYACSIFTALGDPELPLLGRNLDNNQERAVLMGLYTPPDGHASIAVSNMVHLGFDKGEDPTQLPLNERLLLLNSVLFSDDGINACGVSVALASVDDTPIDRNENKKLVCISYLIREILDHASNLEEAIQIVENHDVFDKNVDTISHHLLIGDASGHSVITEYNDGEWRFMPNDVDWQVVTNTRLYNVSETMRRMSCWRYNTAITILEQNNGTVTCEEGMDILESISVSGTQWSALYDMMNRNVYISLYREYHDILFLALP